MSLSVQNGNLNLCYPLLQKYTLENSVIVDEITSLQNDQTTAEDAETCLEDAVDDLESQIDSSTDSTQTSALKDKLKTYKNNLATAKNLIRRYTKEENELEKRKDNNSDLLKFWEEYLNSLKENLSKGYADVGKGMFANS